MKKLLFLFLFCSIASFAQQHVGYCKITKVEPDKSQFAKITFKFLTPEGKPALSRVAVRLDKDTVIQPEIQSDGTYTMVRLPGTHTFSFYVKFWHDVDAKPMKLKAGTHTYCTVKFDAQEIGSSPTK